MAEGQRRGEDWTGYRPGAGIAGRPSDVVGRRPGVLVGGRPGVLVGGRPGVVVGRRPGVVVGRRPGVVVGPFNVILGLDPRIAQRALTAGALALAIEACATFAVP